MGNTIKEKTIIFYGSDWTPLSDECYGCHHFGYICEGSVYGAECRAGIVEDIVPSVLANLIMRQINNRFGLARIWGYDLKEDINEEQVEKIKEDETLSKEYQEALETPEVVVQHYKELFGLDMYAEKQIYNSHVEEENESGFEDKMDPFSEENNKNFPEITEDDLPF